MEQRVEHLDIAKGISITLVALFHSHIYTLLEAFLRHSALFRMPLFFLVSGIFLSLKYKGTDFLKRKFHTLLKPYFFVLFMVFLFFVFRGDDELLWHFKGIFYANGHTIEWVPMWFLPHLFLLQAVALIFVRYAKINEWPVWVKWLFLLAWLLIGSHYVSLFYNIPIEFKGHIFHLPGLPFSLDLLVVSLPFFLMGHIGRGRFSAFKPNHWIALVALVLFVVISSFTDAHINLHERIYTIPLLATLAAFLGIYLVLYASFWFARVDALKKVFIRLGKTSLFILIFHQWLGDHSYTLMLALAPNWITTVAFLSLLISLVVPILIKIFVNQIPLLGYFFSPDSFSRSMVFPGRNKATVQ